MHNSDPRPATTEPELKHILVVDDEPEIRDYLRALLESENYRVSEAVDGIAARDLISSDTSIDLVLSDVMMPKMDGTALLDYVKARNPIRPAFILMSGYARISLQEAYDRGAAAFFPKPFKSDALLTTIQVCLEPKETRWTRKASRYPAPDRDLILTISVQNLLAATYSAGIINIGQGGMFLAWGRELPQVGETIHFEIRFSNAQERSFSGQGIVRWVREQREDGRLPGFGLEFTQIPEAQAIDLIDVMNFVKTREFIPQS